MVVAVVVGVGSVVEALVMVVGVDVVGVVVVAGILGALLGPPQALLWRLRHSCIFKF